MKGRHPVKLHTGYAQLPRSIRDSNQKNFDEQTSVSRVPPTEYSPVGTSSGFSYGNILLPDPPKCRKNGKDFYFRDAPGIHSISPFSYFSPYFSTTGFQSCCSVSGIRVCNGEVAGLSDQDEKDWVVSSRGSFFILSSCLPTGSSTNADSCLYCFFLQINHFSLPVHSPSTPSSLSWSLKKTNRPESDGATGLFLIQ